MTLLNAYATLAQYKAYAVARGQTASTDTTDDALIEDLLISASRYIDYKTGRHYYPRVETRYLNTPNSRTLELDADLLEVISVVNGDGTTIPSTEYDLIPRNTSPHYAIRLKDASTYIWSTDGAGSSHYEIAITGIYGCHTRYSDAWLLGSTAAEALDDNEVEYDVTSGTPFLVGNLIRFDNEIGYVSSKSNNTLTLTRGANGSTATTHLTGINVYIWQFMEEVRLAVLEMTLQAYKRRSGQSATNTSTITAAGVVLTPRDIPTIAAEFINAYKKIV